MKKPLAPPDFNPISAIDDFWKREKLSAPKGGDIFVSAEMPSPVTEKGEYIHWDKLRHLYPVGGAEANRRWQLLKFARTGKGYALPFADEKGRQFWFCQTEALEQFQHWVDKRAAGFLGAEEPKAFNKERQTRFLMNGLKEEAIHSSILEGAATTVAAAREVLARKNPKPGNDAERMYINNYRAMQFMREMRDNLTASAVLELHRILAEGTMPPEETGRLRRRDDIVVSDNTDGAVLHEPPPAATVKARMKKLCDFANGKTPKTFLHPAIRAMIVHFMIGFIHPFADGNGRTARALFYWTMMKNGYWLMPHASISEVVRRAPGQYKRAFLLTETDGNDITYFLLHQAKVVRKAFERLDKYVRNETCRVRDDENVWRQLAEVFNLRQVTFLRHAEKNPGDFFSVYEHQARHNVSYPTALYDLRKLMDLGVLSRYKRGKEYVYEIREGALEKLKRKRR